MYIKGNKHHATVSLIQTDENTYVMSNDVIMTRKRMCSLVVKWRARCKAAYVSTPVIYLSTIIYFCHLYTGNNKYQYNALYLKAVLDISNI